MFDGQDSLLLGAVHVALLRVVVGDMEEAHASGAAAVRALLCGEGPKVRGLPWGPGDLPLAAFLVGNQQPVSRRLLLLFDPLAQARPSCHCPLFSTAPRRPRPAGGSLAGGQRAHAGGGVDLGLRCGLVARAHQHPHGALKGGVGVMKSVGKGELWAWLAGETA